jgi:hypothetical protein
MSQPVSGPDAPDSPQTRLATQIGKRSRAYAWVATTVALLIGFYLAIRNYNGVGTAAVFAVAFLFGIVAFGGILPTALKVGDVEVMLQNAKQEGKAEGAVQAAQATAQMAKQVAKLEKAPEDVVAQLPVPDDVKPAIKDALDVVQQAATTDPQEWRNTVEPAKPRPTRYPGA